MARPLRLVSRTLVYAQLGLSCLVACDADTAPGAGGRAGAGGEGGGEPNASAGVAPLAGQGGSAAGAGGSAGSVLGHGGSSGSVATRCDSVPPSDFALLDDFQDGNATFYPAPGRFGIWFTIHDTTPGSIAPEGEVVGVAGGANGTDRSAHVVASGYSAWGAALASTMQQFVDGEGCPYNASAFAGVRFYARGTGQVRIALQIPEVVSREFGGTCDPEQGMVCFDQHGKHLALSEDWQLFELAWSDLTQRDFGTQVALRPEAIMGLQFSFESVDLPGELWVDEVSFWEDGGGSGGGGAGQGGEGGAGQGGAGQAGEGGSERGGQAGSDAG